MTDPRDYSLIPYYTQHDLELYVELGVPVGDFLGAVLANDLFTACGRADLSNLGGIVALVMYIYNRCPIGCHGSKEAVTTWIEVGGLRGLITQGQDKEVEP